MDSGRQVATLDEQHVGTSRRRSAWLSPAVPVALVVLFALATVQVRIHGPMVHLDLTIRDWVETHQHPGWRRFAVLVTHAGTPILDVIVLMVVATVVSLIRRSWRSLATASLAVALLTATVWPAKVLIGRPGPGSATDTVEGAGYFPSGHTASTLVCYGAIALLLTANRWMLLAAASMGVFVAASMVYGSFHWASDVVAGYLLAVTVLWTVNRLCLRAPAEAVPR